MHSARHATAPRPTAPRMPRGPNALQTLRILASLPRRPLRTFTNAARGYGDFAKLDIPSRSIYLLSHPDLLEDVLVTNGRRYDRGGALHNAHGVFGEGLLTSTGETHLRHRRLIQPLFDHRRVNGHAAAMTEAANQTADGWAPGMVVDVVAEMTRISMTVIARTLFSTDLRDDTDEVGAAVNTVLSLFTRRLLPTSELVDHLPLPSSRRYLAAERTLVALIDRMIEERSANPGEHDDLLKVLLTAPEDAEHGPMTDAQVRGEAMTMFLAGHETTGAWLSWTWHLLAIHPEVEARLHEELDSVLNGRQPALGDYAALGFTRRVLTESMRLIPPAWIVTRRAPEDTMIGDHHVAAGSSVMMSQWVVHRDPRWFDHPARFDPDRWEGRPDGETARFAYFPFGGGAMKCPGEPFARLEATLVLATLAQRWRLRPQGDGPVPLLASISLRPRDGISLVVERRD